METDLSRIQELGEQKRDENHAFRRFLKVRRHSDRTLRHLAERIETQIDCRACANCCRLTTTGVSARDIKRLSSFLRRSIKDVLATFTVESEDEGLILQRTNTGACVFLDGNDCTVYDARPETCQRFPNLVRGNGSLVTRMWQFVDRAVYCPIVYHSMEAFKDALGFRR